jgi:hypothetical protein
VVTGVGRDELVSRLVRIGEKEMTGEDEAEVDAYFTPDFRFHGPDGREWDYQGLKGYFGALRAAFDGLTITRGIVIVEGNYVACQTSIAGRFVREFTHSPLGPLPPTRGPGRVRADEYLPLRRRWPPCRGVDPDRQPQRPASARRRGALTPTEGEARPR